MLTRTDLEQIKKLIHKEVRINIKHLPTKDEFFTAMDKLSKQIKDLRDEFSALFFRVKDHEERITDLEKIHPSSPVSP